MGGGCQSKLREVVPLFFLMGGYPPPCLKSEGGTPSPPVMGKRGYHPLFGGMYGSTASCGVSTEDGFRGQ